ncbi:MAG TPA: hypothetical protein VFX67_06010 [Burkholderiales bacterium]|nr:hypothetical protein [Burkholderiales bacterium]
MSVQKHELERAVEWLERGDWQRAHAIVQQDEESMLSCWAHGIVHRMEGDTSNARYWYGQAKRSFAAEAAIDAEVAALKEAVARA